MNHVLALPGSLRRGSCNRLLLEAAVERAPGNVAITIYDGLASIPSFNEDLEQAASPGPNDVRLLRERVASADGLLIATPEYNHSIPGVLKNAIDWLSRPPAEPLAGKPVAIVGASRGRWGTRLAQGALRQVLYATESLVLPKPSLFVSEADRLFDGAGRLIDSATGEKLTSVLESLSHWIALAQRADG